MTLDDFKTIFFWEYVHRLLGRLIGLAFALPLLWFWWRRAIPDRLWLEARRPARARRAAGRDRLVDGRLGPGRRARGQPYPPRRPPAHRPADLRRHRSGSRSTCRRSAANAAARPARMPLLGIWALVPALPAIPVRRLCRRARGGLCLQQLAEDGRGMVPGRNADAASRALRNFVDNPIVVQFVHRWLAFARRRASPSGSASRAWRERLLARGRRC